MELSDMDRHGTQQKTSTRDKKISVVSAFSLLILFFGILVYVISVRVPGGGGGKGGTTSGSGEGNQTGDGTGNGASNAPVAATAATEPPPVPPEPAVVPVPFEPVTNFMLVDNSPPPPPQPAPPVASSGGRDAGSGGGTGGGVGTGNGRGRGRGDGPGTKPLGIGDISFRMYWNPPVQDIDLHVIDPNGHHLWYSAKGCPCQGELDRDDTTSGGPENIYWPKGQGPSGQYTYYALYYSGNGQKTVTIQVREGEKILKNHKYILSGRGDESIHYTYDLVKEARP